MKIGRQDAGGLDFNPFAAQRRDAGSEKAKLIGGRVLQRRVDAGSVRKRQIHAPARDRKFFRRQRENFFRETRVFDRHPVEKQFQF